MIVKSGEELKGSASDVSTEKWRSLRFLLEKDEMAFTMTDTTVKGGTEQILWYKNHLEACYCIEGEIEDLKNRKIHAIKPVTICALDQHDRRRIRAYMDLRLICCFNPPLKGGEKHDNDGSYAR
jgi:L-ectoine synthase